MKKAFTDDVFAVVDLETTGTQRNQGDHIIQFGCATKIVFSKIFRIFGA